MRGSILSLRGLNLSLRELRTVWANLGSVMAKVWSYRTYLILGRPQRGQSPVEHSEPERADMRLERVDYKPERVCMRP